MNELVLIYLNNDLVVSTALNQRQNKDLLIALRNVMSNDELLSLLIENLSNINKKDFLGEYSEKCIIDILLGLQSKYIKYVCPVEDVYKKTYKIYFTINGDCKVIICKHGEKIGEETWKKQKR